MTTKTTWTIEHHIRIHFKILTEIYKRWTDVKWIKERRFIVHQLHVESWCIYKYIHIQCNVYLCIDYRPYTLPRALVILPIESANQQQQLSGLALGYEVPVLVFCTAALYSIWFDSICIRHRLRDDRIRRHSDTTMNRRVPTMPRADSTHNVMPTTHSLSRNRRRRFHLFTREWSNRGGIGC